MVVTETQGTGNASEAAGAELAASNDSRTDEQLVAAHVAGDREAFGELFRRHRDRLWSVALRTLRDAEDAADAVQDGMMRAYHAASGFRGDAAVGTWLHRIVVNVCLDRLRRRARLGAQTLLDEQRAADETAISDPIESGELRLTLRAALATLPEDQRAAVVLVDMEGYPVDEAARLLGVPTGTVKSRCARARAKLAPLLADLRAGNPRSERDVQTQTPTQSPPAPRAGRGRASSRRSGGGQR
jgi:RNA polymerase sigma-70 factor (ECF subfamily)